jgi:hypothetical protein
LLVVPDAEKEVGAQFDGGGVAKVSL